MPVFISYSHADKKVANKLAAHLVKHNANVWVDTWELNVGDSIISRVQEAIQNSSALLVILSKQSVESEWCKKELSAGLIRELDEKRVVVLPVLIEDCEIPMFLREKMYADLRSDFDHGLQSILDAIAKVTNSDQARLVEDDGHVDWSQDWGFSEGLFHLRYTIVQSPHALPMTFLTQVYLFCDEIGTKRYRQFDAADLGWIGRLMIAEILFDFGERKNLHLVLDDQFPKTLEAAMVDTKIGVEYDLYVEARKMGQDNGKNQLISVSEYLKKIREYIRSVSRDPTAEELQRLVRIAGSPWDA